MNLMNETRTFVVWFARLNKVCLKTRPFWTLFVIGATVVSNVAKLLAFLLPLKVVLLAGSDGVPRYFAFFIDSADKDGWIIGLTLGAIVSYILHLSLEALTKRMSLKGGKLVLQNANALSVAGNQERIAQKYYGQVTGLTAEGLLLFLMLLVISIINTGLVLKLLALALIWLMITIIWLSTGKEFNPSWIENNAKLYISVVTSTLFLAGFLLIIHPYIVGGGPNLLLSLVSIVLLKRSSKASYSLIYGSISLRSDRAQVDPLMFRSGKITRKELPTRNALQDLFQKPQREALVRAHLPEKYATYQVDVKWEDQSIRGLYSFKIVATPANGGEQEFLRLNVVSYRNKHLFEREEHLFKYISRESLNAPELVTSFKVEEFFCKIVEYVTGVTFTLPQWRKSALSVLKKQWMVRPPKQLVQDYKLSHQMMWRRFNAEFFERARIAVETEEEQLALDHFINGLNITLKRLSKMPLYIANSEMRASNTISHKSEMDREGLIFWGRWQIVPLGYYLPRLETIKSTLDEVISGSHTSLEDVLWVNNLAKIEQAIIGQNYKKAILLIMKSEKAVKGVEKK
ncbi:hypothetical protein [Nitrincola schmidtii]|uniref:hypothetical protein n=1 Tax=Nitrincola schmidtii TaxID=1730894 RepID=UPI00124C6857|nr:hypothetical protein [Nitrincola schmidtii]